MIAAGLCLILLPETKFAYIINLPICIDETIKVNEDFDRKFREGRDLIDKEEWAKAAEKFNEIINKYPANKSADAALYWLSFCYKKQKHFKETDATLDRLLKDFPSSSWVEDARVMKLEIAVPLGKLYNSSVSITNPALPLGTYSKMNSGNNALAGIANATAPQTYERLKTLGEINTAASQSPLDREDEIKLAAFQSLFSADSKRGIEVMSEVLKSDSRASENLKLEVLRAVRRPRITGTYSSLPLGKTLTTNSVEKQSLPLLRESLFKSFQHETNIKIRKEIIYTLANLKDEQSVNYLIRLYSSEDNREIKKAIINGFGSSMGISGFYVAGNSLIHNPDSVAAGNVQTQAAEFGKLLEIVKTENDGELRLLALSNLQRFVGWERNAQLVEILIRVYDSETNEDFKKSIVQNLGKIKQPLASRKLLDIAKNDKSDKLKLEAIYALRNTNTPEALKYLEELIK
jgi:HEAT repeat protein